MQLWIFRPDVDEQFLGGGLVIFADTFQDCVRLAHEYARATDTSDLFELHQADSIPPSENYIDRWVQHAVFEVPSVTKPYVVMFNQHEG